MPICREHFASGARQLGAQASNPSSTNSKRCVHAVDDRCASMPPGGGVTTSSARSQVLDRIRLVGRQPVD